MPKKLVPNKTITTMKVISVAKLEKKISTNEFFEKFNMKLLNASTKFVSIKLFFIMYIKVPKIKAKIITITE